MNDRAFTSSMTPREYAAALLWLPVHLVLLPLLCVRLMENGSLTESQANLLVYGAGALCLSLLCSGFLRRDFDPLCDNLPGTGERPSHNVDGTASATRAVSAVLVYFQHAIGVRLAVQRQRAGHGKRNHAAARFRGLPVGEGDGVAGEARREHGVVAGVVAELGVESLEEQADTLLSFDIVNLDEIVSDKLRESINREGKVLYAKI